VKISNLSRRSRYKVDDSVVIEMLQDGPITTAVASSGWEGYSRGTFSCSSTAQVDHAVLIVGYTPDSWILKNSWGQDFGDNGFIYVSRDPQHNCKIGLAVHEMSQLTLTLSHLLFIIGLFAILM
jgi:hypothetical protein